MRFLLATVRNKGVFSVGNGPDIELLEKNIGYRFKNKDLIKMALSHSSYINEKKIDKLLSNERLEFLGDSILSMVTTDLLYKSMPGVLEGDLTRARAALVCEGALFSYAKEIGLGDFLYLGKGENQTGGRERPSLLSDAFEAVIAAIYLDGSYEDARKFVLRFVKEKSTKENSQKDYKTVLQEVIQKNPEEKIEYVLVSESGPDHDKRFLIELRLNSNVLAKGIGRSKKAAEQMAAKQVLELLGE